jgi:hypothetical protein
LPEKKKSNLELLVVVENKWLSLFVVENTTFGAININSVTTVDWLPCFYKLTLI